jgi:hypothetical protein
LVKAAFLDITKLFLVTFLFLPLMWFGQQLVLLFGNLWFIIGRSILSIINNPDSDTKIIFDVTTWERDNATYFVTKNADKILTSFINNYLTDVSTFYIDQPNLPGKAEDKQTFNFSMLLKLEQIFLWVNKTPLGRAVSSM